MSPDTPPLTPVRVEQALRLLPELEVLLPLRSLILSVSRPEEQAQWSSHGPYLTVGKRSVEPAELRQRAAEAAEQGQEHVGALYAAYGEALECQQRGEAGAGRNALRQADGSGRWVLRGEAAGGSRGGPGGERAAAPRARDPGPPHGRPRPRRRASTPSPRMPGAAGRGQRHGKSAEHAGPGGRGVGTGSRGRRRLSGSAGVGAPRRTRRGTGSDHPVEPR